MLMRRLRVSLEVRVTVEAQVRHRFLKDELLREAVTPVACRTILFLYRVVHEFLLVILLGLFMAVVAGTSGGTQGDVMTSDQRRRGDE
jgi:hypothetical protein